MECARALGKRAILEGGKTDAERLTYAFRLCVRRKPTADELAVLSGLLEKHRKRFADGRGDRGRGRHRREGAEGRAARGLTYADWAAYTLVARVLLNLDETVTKE